MPSSLSTDEQTTLNRLKRRLDRDCRTRTVNGHKVPGFNAQRGYYQGLQRLEQLGIAVPEELRKFVTIVAWPRTYVDAIVTRLEPQGFLIDGEADETLWRDWQANNLDAEIRMGLTDMCVHGRGYLCGGTNDDDSESPLITVESPLEMIHDYSKRERRTTAAARFFTDDDENGRRASYATFYQLGKTRWLRRDGGEWVDYKDPDEHGLDRVPVEAMVNRSSSADRYGESEMQAIIQLTDAAARALTNAQVATEVMALPQRWAAGMKPEDFKDPRTNEVLTAWEAYFGAVWGTTNSEAKFGQFSAASLDNFKTIVGLYAQQVAGITGLPLRYLGQLSDNPPSADGIRADEARVVGTAEEKQKFADGGIEPMMVTGRLIVTGEVDPRFKMMETYWRSAATPTRAQAADAAVKAFQAGLISKKQARRDMGYSPAQIRQMEIEDEAERTDPVLERIAAGLESAGAGAGGGA